MKTLKISAVLIGIIVAFFTLKTHAAESATGIKSEKSATDLYRTLEERLIKDYLSGQAAEAEKQESFMKVFDANDDLIYEGPANAAKGKNLQLKADFLIALDNTTYYRITGS